MSTAVALNHLIIDLNQTDKPTKEILEERIFSLKWKSFAFNALEKICYVALLAIVAAVFAISYNLIALTGMVPMTVAGLFIISPLLILAPTQFARLAKQYSRQMDAESLTYLKFREIENWTSEQISEFMTQKRLRPDLVPLDSLRQLNPNEPLKPLLPLIARYEVLSARVNSIREKARTAPAQLEDSFRRYEAESGQTIEQQIKQKNRFESRNTYEMLLETDAIPAAFKAALLLQVMQTPGDVELDTSSTLELPRIGTCGPRSFAERQFGKLNEPRDDAYFTFLPDLHREPISHQAIEDCQMNPAELRLLLFPNAIRA